jgi:hypothetical protein
MTAAKPNDPSQTISALREAFIQLPQITDISNRIGQLFRYVCVDEEPEHLMVCGAPGVGKTRLLRRFENRHPRIEHDDVTEIPVLYAPVPSACSIKKLAGAMLGSMGSPYWSHGGEEERSHQLMILLRTCKCRLVVLDEVNHLLDRGSAKTHYAVADWIKQLADAAGISFVLAGTPVAEQLLWTNDQLRGRFSEVVHLAPLSLATTPDTHVFRSLLRTLQTYFGELDSVDLSTPATSRMMAYATGGRLRLIRSLLVRSVQLAHASAPARLDLGILAKAFGQVIFGNAPESRNPFAARFDGQPLDRPGEPFGPERR